ncbi:hypothetical protein GCM10010240_60520 [Streptomyces griseoviridis]|nr:hypothetical protein GCM10010240_60520 [Streptomyces griseoviridis]
MSGTALEWFKSSYSGSEDGQCLEVAHVWCKSSHSGDEGGNCVEVAHERSVIHIRDSKTPTTPPPHRHPRSLDRLPAPGALGSAATRPRTGRRYAARRGPGRWPSGPTRGLPAGVGAIYIGGA